MPIALWGILCYPPPATSHKNPWTKGLSGWCTVIVDSWLPAKWKFPHGIHACGSKNIRSPATLCSQSILTAVPPWKTSNSWEIGLLPMFFLILMYSHRSCETLNNSSPLVFARHWRMIRCRLQAKQRFKSLLHWLMFRGFWGTDLRLWEKVVQYAFTCYDWCMFKTSGFASSTLKKSSWMVKLPSTEAEDCISFSYSVLLLGQVSKYQSHLHIPQRTTAHQLAERTPAATSRATATAWPSQRSECSKCKASIPHKKSFHVKPWWSKSSRTL